MGRLQKTEEFEQDLVEIWEYTAEHWGEKQADTYLRKINACMAKISAGKAIMKTLTENIHFIRCEHHYIFVLVEGTALAIAILHEKMDFLTRLKKRLR